MENKRTTETIICDAYPASWDKSIALIQETRNRSIGICSNENERFYKKFEDPIKISKGKVHPPGSFEISYEKQPTGISLIE